MKKYWVALIVLLSGLVSLAQETEVRSYYVAGDTALYSTDRVLGDSKSINSEKVRIIVKKSFLLSEGQNFEGKGQILSESKFSSESGDFVRQEILVEYSPSEISEFGTKAGDVFVSRELSLSEGKKRFFLQELARGRATLYYLHVSEAKGFYLEMEKNNLIKLGGKKSFKDKLKSLLMDCSEVHRSIEYAQYNASYLSKLVERYNSCSADYIPRFTFGGIIGLNTGTYAITFDSKLESASSAMKYGLWLESPIERSRYSVRFEVNYSSFDLAVTEDGSDGDLDYLASANVIGAPLTLKVSSLNPSQGFFAHMGPQVTINLNAKQELYETSVDGNLVTTNSVGLPEFPQIGYGAILGVGGYKKIHSRRGVSAELRISYSAGSEDDFKYSATETGVFVFYNF